MRGIGAGWRLLLALRPDRLALRLLRFALVLALRSDRLALRLLRFALVTPRPRCGRRRRNGTVYVHGIRKGGHQGVGPGRP